MRPARRFIEVLRIIARYLPRDHPLLRYEGARRILAREAIADVAAEFRLSEQSLERTMRVVQAGNLTRIAGRVGRVTLEQVAEERFRLAQLLLGALTEERFDREKEELTAGRLKIEDHRLGRTDTDYRVLNGGGRPIFRINIKFHGSAFEKAREWVGLASDDCFALATYEQPGTSVTK